MDLFRCDLEILIAINGVGDGEPVQCPPVIWLHAWRCQTPMQCCRVACSRRCWFLWWAAEPRNCPVNVDIIPVTRSSGLVFLIATKQNLRNTGLILCSRVLMSDRRKFYFESWLWWKRLDRPFYTRSVWLLACWMMICRVWNVAIWFMWNFIEAFWSLER